MRAAEAAEVLNDMRYKPGSEVAALEMGDFEVGMIASFMSWETTPQADGSQTNRPSQFSTPLITISTRSLDREGVQAAGLNALLEVEAHEAREMWREKSGTHRAPFHPHNRSTEAAWQRTRSIPVTVGYPAPNGA